MFSQAIERAIKKMDLYNDNLQLALDETEEMLREREERRNRTNEMGGEIKSFFWLSNYRK